MDERNRSFFGTSAAVKTYVDIAESFGGGPPALVHRSPSFVGAVAQLTRLGDRESERRTCEEKVTWANCQ
jgi:hypothetical protein